MNLDFLDDKFIDKYIDYCNNTYKRGYIDISKLNDYFDTLKGSEAVKMYQAIDTIGGSGREVYFTLDGNYITTYRIGYLIDEMNKDKKFKEYLQYLLTL